MAQPKPQKPKQPESKVSTEPGFEKRLGEMYRKVLHTPPKHVPDKRTKQPKAGSAKGR